jgi:hypothetical protein
MAKQEEKEKAKIKAKEEREVADKEAIKPKSQASIMKFFGGGKK